MLDIENEDLKNFDINIFEEEMDTTTIINVLKILNKEIKNLTNRLEQISEKIDFLYDKILREELCLY